MRITRFAAVLVILFPACSDIVGIDEPLEFPNSSKYFMTPEFPQWWAELEACSKLSRNLDKVEFYHVYAETLPNVLHGIRTVGAYYPRSNRIFIVESEKANPSVIRHEMMHALLRDESDHPPQYFGADGLCGYL